MQKAILYLRNWGLLANKALCTLAGKDPRMTVSAVARLEGWGRVQRLINWLYRNPEHCKEAAQGWDDPRIIDRSLW